MSQISSSIDRRSLIATAAAGASALAIGSVLQEAHADEAETNPAPWGEATPVAPFEPKDPTYVIPAAPDNIEDTMATPDFSLYSEPNNLLKGKVAIVTGASSGIGREIARLFAREGAKVVAVARRAARLQALSQEAADQGYAGEIAGFKADLTDRGQIQQMVDFALENYGHIDILVNDAGVVGGCQHAAVLMEDLWDYEFALNVDAVMFAIKAVIPGMVEQGSGSIINLSSVGGKYGPICGVEYSATKAAVLGITRNTGYVYQQDGVRCNAICPGQIASEIGFTMQYMDDKGLERSNQFCNANQAYGQPQQIASAALFLASDASSYVNAQELIVDAAWTAGQ